MLKKGPWQTGFKLSHCQLGDLDQVSSPPQASVFSIVRRDNTLTSQSCGHRGESAAYTVKSKCIYTCKRENQARGWSCVNLFRKFTRDLLDATFFGCLAVGTKMNETVPRPHPVSHQCSSGLGAGVPQ